ncbi:MAG: peptidase [Candidatus Muproteobacteria bacterium RIFCSPHIGHO2_12_FULL_60_33]|uniref:Peptidase n=1 Tax=Candidatus Muproteobacteria bacterium RIFCSPLOWO2_01_FULL_60_18 TaxID=1817768 RepID=A0A1F6TYV1_9PROT|nr:MAG: peptidase [Candidatus Muproteobacteria bacterium RIFCSPLOWO2_01_FULL_60_18]OGI52528.1 MAG: peptidase [Candidatus Muproteobacteria bacterium RIFCSPHIGHO2_01_60_12]OGI53944.1 MAG: peptidase [Candidatus Muproteobacteria bacterium RIFCSPHIGHO2_12_FULL_60_33]OGI56940.1 MAG: peptidase [Candidatus Muproteobacteria bacterium RIFCSPHIGHO2_02_FULL_60_13]OGI58943.1 MAG: peptidase [Candidatus Muproteobacteria bacterium RIFCSPHIGHO2_01_FULL_61_200]
MAAPPHSIEIDIPSQTLTLKDAQGKEIMRTRISTARNGAGEEAGSEKTPRGVHYIRAKIGAGLPENAVLVSRRPTNEIYSPPLRAAFPNRDWILTRILWLCGREPGKNRLGKVDTMRRYIYIHGCPDADPMGVPGSRGCVKMRNSEIIELFDRVAPGTRVLIKG